MKVCYGSGTLGWKLHGLSLCVVDWRGHARDQCLHCQAHCPAGTDVGPEYASRPLNCRQDMEPRSPARSCNFTIGMLSRLGWPGWLGLAYLKSLRLLSRSGWLSACRLWVCFVLSTGDRHGSWTQKEDSIRTAHADACSASLLRMSGITQGEKKGHRCRTSAPGWRAMRG